MQYRQFMQDLFAAIEIPIHHYHIKSGTPVMLDCYEPRCFPQTEQTRATHYAATVSLDMGSFIPLSSADNLAAVCLQDKSLVILGPLRWSSPPPTAPASAPSFQAPVVPAPGAPVTALPIPDAPLTITLDAPPTLPAPHAPPAPPASPAPAGSAPLVQSLCFTTAQGLPTLRTKGMKTLRQAAATAPEKRKWRPSTAPAPGSDSHKVPGAGAGTGARADDGMTAMDTSVMAQLIPLKLRTANMWCSMISQITVRQELPPGDEIKLYQEADELIPTPIKNISREIQLNAPHNQYRYELAILDAISEGDEDKVVRAFRVPLKGKFGVLGPTPLRSMQNHVHNLNSLASRTAIRAGILPEKAYALSDKFFMAAEFCQTIEQCLELRVMCARSFAAMVREYREKNTGHMPPLVQNALLAISRMQYGPCSVQSIAADLEVSPVYLERLFKKSTGLKISEHIRQEKIKKAEELLRDTSQSISDIARILGFNSGGHLAAVFKKHIGLTPRQYRQYKHTLNQG